MYVCMCIYIYICIRVNNIDMIYTQLYTLKYIYIMYTQNIEIDRCFAQYVCCSSLWGSNMDIEHIDRWCHDDD